MTDERRFFPVAPTGNRQARRMTARAARGRTDGKPRMPRVIAANAIDLAINKVSCLTEPERKQCLSPARDGFARLREGVATYEQWAAVVSAVAVGLAIEDLRVVKGMRAHFEAAERALDAVWSRVEGATGGATWGRRTTLHFDEIEAMREAIHLHDFQLQNVSVSELHQAAANARAKVRHAGGQEIAAPANSIPQPIQQRLV
jgi:hypothetical protein